MTTDDTAGWLRQGETLQRSTLIELFFDLAFVYGMTQLSAVLAERLSWSTAYQVLLLTMALWWTWSVTTWATDLYAQKAGLRALVIALMFGVLLLSSSIPHAFDVRGLSFAVTYVVLQMSRTSVLLLATRRHPLRKRPARVLTWFAVSAFLWIPGAVVHGMARVMLWTAAVVLEYGSANLGWPTPWLGRSALSEWDLVEEHMAERYRQILIIGLGDMILTMGNTYAAVPPHALYKVALAISFLTTVVMWQIYSFRAGERITTAFTPGSSRARPARKLDWDHLVMVGGVVVSAVGAKLVIGHPSGHTPWAWIAVIVGGPALFLAGRVHFGHVVFGQLSMPRIFGLAALGALLPVLRLLSPIAVAAVTVAVLLAVISPDLPELWRPSPFTAPNIRMKHGHPPGPTPTRTRPEPGPPSEHQPAPGDLSD